MEPGSPPPPPPIPEPDRGPVPRPPGSPAPTPPAGAPRPPGPTPTSSASTPRPLGRPAFTPPAGARPKRAQKQEKKSKLDETKASFQHVLNQAKKAARKSFSSPEKLLTGLSQKDKHALPAPVSPSGKIREARKSAEKAKKSQESKDNRRKLMKQARDKKKKVDIGKKRRANPCLDEKWHGGGEETA